MRPYKRFLWIILSCALVTSGAWDAYAWHNTPTATPGKKPTWRRADYWTRAAREPFTFRSTWLLSSSKVHLRLETTDATDSRGKTLWHEFNYFSPTDKTPTYEEANTVTPQGAWNAFVWSKDIETLHKPLLVTHDLDWTLMKEHLKPEKNCTVPEPNITFLRNEPLWIGGRSYPTTVVFIASGEMKGTYWYLTTPGLGCLKVKTVSHYIDPSGDAGTTTQEPVSLTLGEPDANEMDVEGRISRSETEFVPRKQISAHVEQRAKEYKAQIAAMTGPAPKD